MINLYMQSLTENK